MYDHQTGSYWFQVGGEAVVGTLTGSRLKLLPSAIMAWGEWKNLYPRTRLLAGTAGFPTVFTNNRYSGGIPMAIKELCSSKGKLSTYLLGRIPIEIQEMLLEHL